MAEISPVAALLLRESEIAEAEESFNLES